jgi:hypothetical protein
MDLKHKYFFVLGGTDNEMEEIKTILNDNEIGFIQPTVNWGDIKVPNDQIPTEETDKTLVFVECRPQEKTREKEVIIIDHHGKLRRRSASLLQVCKLLQVKPSLKQRIIASIDADFLSKTIHRFPRHKDYILELWEEGYKKRFKNEVEWHEFKKHCQALWKKAKADHVIGDRTAVVWNSPPSMTMLGALANLDGWACLLVCGSPTTHTEVPAFFQGNMIVVDRLIEMDLERSYYGRSYIGFRAIPSEIVEIVKTILSNVKI